MKFCTNYSLYKETLQNPNISIHLKKYQYRIIFLIGFYLNTQNLNEIFLTLITFRIFVTNNQINSVALSKCQSIIL